MKHTTIGEEIRNIRKERGMTIQDLAEKSGVTNATIVFYENGKILPKLRTLYKIAVALNCDYDYLVELVQNEKN